MYVDTHSKAEMMVESVSDWIKQQVEEAGCKGTVTGLSGGIDSAVVAALSKRVFPEDTLGVIMPCYSEPRDEEDALLFAEHHNINVKNLDLSETYDSMVGKLDDTESTSKMALANIKPRLRMTVLYYYAQTYKYLVLGTSNKSELILGYFTKYGDGAADLLPIATFTKMEVYALARQLEIPERLIKRPPTAGIISGQTDEDEMGFTYDELEKYFKGEQISKDVKNKIERLERINAHKRSMPPIYTPKESLN
ncbi:NAD(+) synthase [Natranaerobius thermophilus]|uniref:NH(3)-dependent NAD(+) synthetase n=1 Tax=Natranaerobius thermophilus (strain ATCC BAA-1301 / DSM 18059 / JW/NM-WN-LF) TaxID=457570 RepID=B2A5L9_NATTJ|nr:NAD+ synthetase [Natranaerobius thermophilus JW/NM-WN-LF]